jgi:hypothetical protein
MSDEALKAETQATSESLKFPWFGSDVIFSTLIMTKSSTAAICSTIPDPDQASGDSLKLPCGCERMPPLLSIALARHPASDVVHFFVYAPMSLLLFCFLISTTQELVEIDSLIEVFASTLVFCRRVRPGFAWRTGLHGFSGFSAA